MWHAGPCRPVPRLHTAHEPVKVVRRSSTTGFAMLSLQPAPRFALARTFPFPVARLPGRAAVLSRSARLCHRVGEQRCTLVFPYRTTGDRLSTGLAEDAIPEATLLCGGLGWLIPACLSRLDVRDCLVVAAGANVPTDWHRPG
jgi:hypothetical protein